ncbi:hypothetical protein RR48_14591 [Papilio machaon]|uniref:Uncharacterized protein n=1 Tax=Papilio machaon TaxID=76193 RepID=A0A194QL95_PAPMA|nr:hypothetical protein RR48_14591 [Papilio machaon]
MFVRKTSFVPGNLRNDWNDLDGGITFYNSQILKGDRRRRLAESAVHHNLRTGAGHGASVRRARRRHTTEERRRESEQSRALRDCVVCAVRALYFGRGGTLTGRRLIGTSRDARRKDAGGGEDTRETRGGGGRGGPSECSHHRSMHGSTIDRRANAPRAAAPAPLSNTVSKQSGVYPRLARTDRVASRLRGALAAPIIFVTGIAPKPIPASSGSGRDARSGLAAEAAAAAARIACHSTPAPHRRIGSRLMKRSSSRQRAGIVASDIRSKSKMRQVVAAARGARRG